ncbi:MAG: N-6 DNA methylase [Chloroflexi bacterium GWB2_49_20]|nr:MAG: N-6 DNA methylase [Chloroflexi bacterium GWB2_49_20]OGN79243.1 MAG: N-6 DNA methylase [Chloroflexi bacterium GWC2_49_37]OGN82987.1 MAG: N-6 DNA methylase [Chloroflexi bacterium GWD2_49_16]HCC78644.1 RNA methyltransferase [Anaerolineae bacterium]
MDKLTLIATSTFGLEAVVKRELIAMGFEDLKTSEGKVEFQASPEEIPTPNLWLRCADRVLLKLGEFPATTFDELFEQTKALSWEDWITPDGKFTVNGKSIKSTLGSISACQSIVKKAVVEKLKAVYHREWFEETGAEFTVQVALLKDVATLTIDTSGPGLNRRGYRTQAGAAALKETLASALVQLSFWEKDRLLIDPMCGSGTILIEAAMLGKNIAPGQNRSFASEEWPGIPSKAWRVARLKAYESVDKNSNLQLFGYDIDPVSVDAARINARKAGVGNDILFEQKDMHNLWIDKQYGILISNPPYGIKVGEFKEMNAIYISLNKTFKKKTGWSVYILTADKKFPAYFKRAQPDRVRKLFNGQIEVNYYQYYGERPKEEAGSSDSL